MRANKILETAKSKWKPKEREGLTGDAFKTLFVARLNYEVTEEDIKQEFEYYGPIKSASLITDPKTSKSRGIFWFFFCFLIYLIRL